ncbi:MAG TPA: FtsW/RodA/SpoVE family cell cycle protein [Planctomycetota bacterium]|nr:FtsW/RodA/SpoVE family cell cycle protein [Planctomycetota bacterium]
MRLGDYDIGLPVKRLPLLLLLAVVVMVAYGVIFVNSAAGRTGLAGKHLLWAGLGAVAFVATFLVDFRVFVRAGYLAYAVGLLALVAVLFTAPVKGARSWFDLGFMKAQPSEFMKLALIMALARFLSARPGALRARDLALALALAGVPVALILKQPDMGTAMVCMPMIAAAVFVGGARLLHLGALAGSGAGGAVLVWFKAMHEYQRERVYAWIDPEPYKLGKAYQLIQSLIAVGSGGLLGKGLGQGTQNQFDLLPLKESDFIFSVIAEEGGFIAAAGLLVAVTVLLLAGTAIALHAADREGQIVAAMATALLGGQAVINVAVCIGLLPTTGITLPFVSYGGSSMLTCFVVAGLLANVAARPQKPGLFG